MNLTWKQLVLCGAAVVLTGAIGYHYWVKGGSQEDASGNTSETEPNGNKVRVWRI